MRNAAIGANGPIDHDAVDLSTVKVFDALHLEIPDRVSDATAEGVAVWLKENHKAIDDVVYVIESCTFRYLLVTPTDNGFSEAEYNIYHEEVMTQFMNA